MPDVHEKSLAHPFPVLDGHGLRLRPWDPESEADVATWLRGLSDPEFQRWNTPVKIVRDLGSARDSLRSRAEAVADGTAVTFCITDAATGTTLGHIGVNDINHVIRVGIVGYWVLPEARGRQVATRALALAARYAFGAVRLHRIELGHALGHDASCRIAERCGFPYEGTLREAMFESGRHDAFRDVHLHARIATDPEPTLPVTGSGPR
ncbi:GNAT family N-acetyltransferase [Streptomyces olivochromogenes]|uniref:Acetyltransferase n=1 Tax=Streptomyces olivochromogenes TaxID=1963 RepID=A0A250VH23_STROL|nr:GNAT family N-acetyltransferase [Streptomyces olivochromogenes]KUN45029.1 acetyltransferase [Streptomyces olivochromogenes]GAX53394.1 acetyltransferase [Streptomyces olivochromogenes]